MLRTLLALVALVALALPVTASAQETITPVGTYDVRWTAMCPTDGYLTDDGQYRPGGSVIDSGQMPVVVDVITYPDGFRFWQARHAVTGATVWGYADGSGSVQDLSIPWPAACETYFCRGGWCTYGTFDWDPATATDDAPYRSFSIHIPSSQYGITASVLGVRALAAAITSPTNNATVSNVTTVSMQAAGWNASVILSLAVDGQTISTGQPAPVSSANLDWDTRTVPNGPHRLTLTATDRSGRTATASVTVNVSNQAAATRTVTITAPTSGQVVSGTTPVRVQLTGFAAGARSFVLLVDNVQRQTGTVSTDSFTLWFNTTRVPNGTRTFTVRVTQGGQTVTAQVQATVGN